MGLPCACSPPLLVRLKRLLMLAIYMVTMDMDMPLAMPTMDTMDTHMPTTMDITMARGPLMRSQLLPMARDLLMLSPPLMLLMLIMDMDITLDMPTMDTMDTHMPTTMDTTMARGPLMLSPLLLLSPRLMLMLSTDTDTDLLTMDMDMPTMDTMDIHMPTMDTTMARGPLMLSPPLMLPMLIMDMDITLAMPTMD